MPLFDAYLAVDWSAAAKPSRGANSIWIASSVKDARFRHQMETLNPPTRSEAHRWLADRLEGLLKRRDKVFVGFDFAFGYPTGTAGALGLKAESAPPWAAMHSFLRSKLEERPGRNRADARFAVAAGMNFKLSGGPGPFWGGPAKAMTNSLQSTKPGFDALALPEWRHAERALMQLGAKPKSVWQLAYAGSVGSQSLMGIPHLSVLRERFPTSRIWPFEFAPDASAEEVLEEADIVFAEIYPSLFGAAAEPGGVLDEAQAKAAVSSFREADEARRLGPRLELSGVAPEAAEAARREEGWVLGA